MICPYCRNSIVDDAKYCPFCGKEISNRNNVNVAVNSGKAKVLLPIAIVFAAFVVLFQVLYFVSEINDSPPLPFGIDWSYLIYNCILPLLSGILLLAGCCLFPKITVIAVIAAFIIAAPPILSEDLRLILNPDFAAKFKKDFLSYAVDFSLVIGAAAFMVLVNVHRRIGLSVVFKIIVLLIYGINVCLRAASLIFPIKMLASYPHHISDIYEGLSLVLFYLSLILLAFVCPISFETPKDTVDRSSLDEVKKLPDDM